MGIPALGNQYAYVIENNAYGRDSHLSLKDPLFPSQYMLLLESGFLSNSHIFQELPTFLHSLFYAETRQQWLVSSGDRHWKYIHSNWTFKIYLWSSYSLMPRWSSRNFQVQKGNSGAERFANIPKAMQYV